MIDETRGRRMLFSAWITVMGVIIWQEIKVNQRAPEPSRLTGATVAISILDLAAPTIGWPVAGVMGLGLAIGLSLMRVAKPSPGPDQPGTTSSLNGGSGLFTIPPTANNPLGLPTTTAPQPLPGTPPGTFNPLPGGFGGAAPAPAPNLGGFSGTSGYLGGVTAPTPLPGGGFNPLPGGF